MKLKLFITLAFFTGFALRGESQDTTKTHTNKAIQVQVNHIGKLSDTTATNEKNTPQIYRDTRLGSSEPQYNTYKKNDYGAGAVTTSPK